MKYKNTLLTTFAVVVLATGCVKPVQTPPTQPVYPEPQQQQQQPVYEDATPIVYEDPNPTSNSGVVYGDLPTDSTVITPNGGYSQPAPVSAPAPQPVYTNPYETGGAATYPDPYAGQSAPATSYPAPSAPTGGQGGGIHLQVAALKDYYAAEEFKNTLSLAPGQSAYVQRGAMNKVIVSGISSVAEANRLKNSRFPGAFIVQGGQGGGGYTPEPSYNTGGGAYSINDPYAVSSSSSSSTSVGGIGVQIGAFSSRAKAQEVADMKRGGKYTPVVKKIGRYYKVILTGFSSRSEAKAHASRVGGFVVSSY